MSNKEYRPTLAQLRTFTTIAEHKHFGTAAAKLGISQPSLSQALVALETGLGIQLVERSTRRVLITSAGEKLLPYAKATLDAAEAFMTHAQGATGTLSGQLRFGIIPTAAPYILPVVLAEARVQYPNLELSIIEDQTPHLLQMLRDGAIDCALLALPTEQSGLVELPLYTENFQILVPETHLLADKTDLPLDALHDLELILLDDGHCLRDQVLDLCRQAEATRNTGVTSETRAASLTTVIQLIVAGHGVTLIPESATAGYLPETLRTASFDPGVGANRRIGIVYRISSTRTEEFQQLGQLVAQAFTKIVT